MFYFVLISLLAEAMSDKSAIEWTDATWNPVTGCTKISPGCAYCYAESITLRFKRGGPFLPGKTTINLHHDRLDAPRPRTHVLIETFTANLRERLGFTHFGEPEVIRNTQGAPMFYMLFASRHPKGLDFWSKASERTAGGQRKMF